jgi:hypothetical protein
MRIGTTRRCCGSGRHLRDSLLLLIRGALSRTSPALLAKIVAGTRSKISQSCVVSLAFFQFFFFWVNFVSYLELMMQLRKRC